jgi:transposase-like protein
MAWSLWIMAERGLTSTQQFWLDHVAACAAAGVSMKAYAEQHGLNVQSFYGWKEQLKKRGLVSPAPSSTDANAMIPVAFVASPQPRVVGGPAARISLANGITIEVPSGVSPEALVRLIGAAMDVPCALEDGSAL